MGKTASQMQPKEKRQKMMIIILAFCLKLHVALFLPLLLYKQGLPLVT